MECKTKVVSVQIAVTDPKYPAHLAIKTPPYDKKTLAIHTYIFKEFTMSIYFTQLNYYILPTKHYLMFSVLFWYSGTYLLWLYLKIFSSWIKIAPQSDDCLKANEMKRRKLQLSQGFVNSGLNNEYGVFCYLLNARNVSYLKLGRDDTFSVPLPASHVGKEFYILFSAKIQ